MDGIRGLGSLRDPSVCMRGGILHEVALAFRLRRALGGRFALGLAFLLLDRRRATYVSKGCNGYLVNRNSAACGMPIPMQALGSKSMEGTSKSAATPCSPKIRVHRTYTKHRQGTHPRDGETLVRVNRRRHTLLYGLHQECPFPCKHVEPRVWRALQSPMRPQFPPPLRPQSHRALTHGAPLYVGRVSSPPEVALTPVHAWYP